MKLSSRLFLKEQTVIDEIPHYLGDIVEWTARRYPEKEAVVFGEYRQSWSTFSQEIEKLSAILLNFGVLRGDRIGIISTTRPEYLSLYLAAARIGAILVGFNVLFTAPEIVRLADITQPKLLVTIDYVKDKPVAQIVMSLLPQMPYVENVLVIGDRVPEGMSSFQNYPNTSQPGDRAALEQRRAELHPDDPALIVFTSGSTGIPKGAVLTHRSILTTGSVQARDFGVRFEDRLLQNKPMSHVGGSINLTIPAILVGATIVFMDNFNPIHALEIVQKERISILAQVPTMFIMEFNLPNFHEYDLSSIRLAVVGGAATPITTMYKILEIADIVITGYGMTETGGYVTFTRPEDSPETISTTVGQVAPEYELQIVGQNRNPLPTGEFGEVAMRGDCLLREYFDNPQATLEAFSPEGWFYSGDIGFLDERGYLTLVDRQKDMYITGGYNVYPREIELYIAQHPKVALVAVLGINDPIRGEIGVACINSKSMVTENELRAYCLEGLAEYKIPRHFLLLSTIPLTPLGKIDKPRLRQEVLKDGLFTD